MLLSTQLNVFQRGKYSLFLAALRKKLFNIIESMEIDRESM